MQLRFPKERRAWNNYVERLLVEFRVDFDRLWRNLPQIPDPEMGLPFMGPLSPIVFCHPNQPCADASGGTPNTIGSLSQDTAGGCPITATVEFSGVTDTTCGSCNNFNRQFTAPQVAGGVTCSWRFDLNSGSGSGMCTARWIDIAFQGPTAWSVTVFTSSFVIVKQYTVTQGFTSPVTLNRFGVAAGGGCNWPATCLVTF